MKVKIATSIGGVLLGGLLLAGSANANTIDETYSYGPRSTNWTTTINVDKFNPSLGTLTGINILLDGVVTGSIMVENKGDDPATINSNLQATINLSSSAGNLSQVIPVYSDSWNAPAFDGYRDYGGTSGETLLNRTGTATSSNSYDNSSSQFLLFIGSSTLSLNLRATGQSIATSSNGNVSSDFDTNARATVEVIYTYTSAVPEPATMILFGLGIVGLTGFIRRKN